MDTKISQEASESITFAELFSYADNIFHLLQTGGEKYRELNGEDDMEVLKAIWVLARCYCLHSNHATYGLNLPVDQWIERGLENAAIDSDTRYSFWLGANDCR